MKKFKLESIPDYGDHMTLEDFIEYCKHGSFIDYDGYGRYATDTQIVKAEDWEDGMVRPSDITGRYSSFNMKTGEMEQKTCKIKIDRRFTHVVWFNR